jgi:sugar O-acyltransferase (sialic acid O-acetyltransferase NeuD family)
MNDNVVVYGAGGHGKVVGEILAAMGRSFDGFIDDDVALFGKTVLGLRISAADEWLKAHPGSRIALGIGDNRAREQSARRVNQHGCVVVSAIHPAATVSKSAIVAEGVVIMAIAVLNADCRVAEGAIINTGAIVEHDVHIGRYSHISPNAVMGGGSRVGAYAHIGMSASILPLKRVGEGCIIGAGAVVVEDVPDGQIAYGVPARIRFHKSP